MRSEVVTKGNLLRLETVDGKKYPTDVAMAETLPRLVQSVSSSEAEPVKL